MALDVERTSVAGSWWRQAPHGADPLLFPSPPSSGRWQRGTSIAAIYLADEEATAWAEWYRALAEIALPPSHGMPRDLWRWTIAVNEIADLSTPAKLAKLDLPAPQPNRRSWAPFQAVARSCTGRAVTVCSTRAPRGPITRRSACSARTFSSPAPTRYGRRPPTATRRRRRSGFTPEYCVAPPAARLSHRRYRR